MRATRRVEEYWRALCEERTAGEPGTEINLGRGAGRMRESRRMTDGGTARGRGMDQSQSIC